MDKFGKTRFWPAGDAIEWCIEPITRALDRIGYGWWAIRNTALPIGGAVQTSLDASIDQHAPLTHHVAVIDVA